MRRSVFVASGVAALALAITVAWARPDRPLVVIYPTADRLPANLLRWYLVFDRPMRTGDSRQHLSLLDAAGRRVERAFLELNDELWDASGTRLTVLFDPGRIKRGLRANLESGPPLVEGRRYTLVVDGGWRDATGRPLGASLTKTFEAIPADRRSPVVGDWRIETPAAATREALVLRFPEILDRALLASTISIVDASGTPIHGAIDVGAGEYTWSFTPARVWLTGPYELRVSSTLEDVAGNSLRRVFDAEMTAATVAAKDVPPVVVRSFSIDR